MKCEKCGHELGTAPPSNLQWVGPMFAELAGDVRHQVNQMRIAGRNPVRVLVSPHTVREWTTPWNDPERWPHDEGITLWMDYGVPKRSVFIGLEKV